MFRFFLMLLLLSILSTFALASCSEADDEAPADGDMDNDLDNEAEMDGEINNEEEIEPEAEAEPELELGPICPVEGDLGVGNHAISLKFDGMERGYEFYVPESYDPSTPTPLLLNIPGFMMKPELEADFTLLNEAAEEKGFIVVYPMSFDGIWNTGLPPTIGDPGELEDVAFIRAVMQDIPSRICADMKRVYATGMSMGASMAHRLACEATDILTAIAPVSGALGVECNPSRPIPVLYFHGIEDNLVSYELGEASVQTWLEKNGCTGEPEVEYFNESYCETYADCEGDSTVVFCSMTPMGHCWPGGSVVLCTTMWDPYNDDINANDYMWEFFKRYSKP